MAKADRRRKAGSRQGVLRTVNMKWRWPAPAGLAERHLVLYQLFMWIYISALGCQLGYFALLGLQPYPQPVVINVIGVLINVLAIMFHRKGYMNSALLLLVVPMSAKAAWWEYQFGAEGGFEYFHIVAIFFICIASLSRIQRLLFSGVLLLFYIGAQYLTSPVYIVSYEFMSLASVVNLVISVTFIAVVAVQIGWEAEQREKRYRRDLRHDQLTGALSRFALLEEGPRLLSRGGLGVLMIDVDHFKAINDTQGHAIGDEVLIELTQRLRHHLRGSDQLCRQGGEEFVALCPTEDREGLQHAAERLLLSINSRAFTLSNGQLLRVTISIGVAQGGPAACAESLLPDLLQRADQAMYRAKREGRNRVVTVWDTPDHGAASLDQIEPSDHGHSLDHGHSHDSLALPGMPPLDTPDDGSGEAASAPSRSDVSHHDDVQTADEVYQWKR